MDASPRPRPEGRRVHDELAYSHLAAAPSQLLGHDSIP